MDEAWGTVVTTVGCQPIPPNSFYPRSQHPKSHIFNPQYGRVLKEYQLIYISEGRGYFESRSCKRQEIEAGSLILLFPGEWHTYEPSKETGWFEYWVGFTGERIDSLLKNGFFSLESPVYRLGFSSALIGMYEDIISYASQERAGYQQMISSIVLYMLGMVYYKNRNAAFTDSATIDKINEARDIMKQEIEKKTSPENIAQRIGVSYSWFRKMFKQYVDVSPAQYQANLRFLRAKELLDTTGLNMTEIAYRLNFDSASQFTTFFKKKAGIPPMQYRKEGLRFKK